MTLKPIYEPLRFDWSRVLDEVEDPPEGANPAAFLGFSATEATHFFSLCISDDELDKVRHWIGSTGSLARESLFTLLERAPRVYAPSFEKSAVLSTNEFPAPVPRVFVTTSGEQQNLPGRIGMTEVECSMVFPTSEVVRSAAVNRSQPFRWADTPRGELWDRVVKPFSRADQILLCDPYAVGKAARLSDPAESGLGYFIRKYGELADEERREMTLHVMSANGGREFPSLSRDDVESLVKRLRDRVTNRLNVKVRMVRFNSSKNEVTLHSRYLVARQGSVETRAMVFDSSVVADARQNPPSPERLINVAVYFSPQHISVFTHDWNRAKKFTDFSV